MERKPKALKIALWSLGVIVFGLLGVLFFATQSSPDHYDFLENRRPNANFLMAVFGLTEVHLYEWDGDYNSLMAKVKVEAAKNGFNYQSSPKHPYRIATFMKGEDRISVIDGRAKTLNDLFQNRVELKGVTVAVIKALPDTWLTKLRVKLQKPIDPMSEPPTPTKP